MEDSKIYNQAQSPEERKTCEQLRLLITQTLPEAEGKLWHGHPVWFIDGNPIVGYGKLKAGIRLMFWSGVSFEESKLSPSTSGKFKDASITYTDASEINERDVKRWLKKAKNIKWDYRNVMKHKGKLVRLK